MTRRKNIIKWHEAKSETVRISEEENTTCLTEVPDYTEKRERRCDVTKKLTSDLILSPEMRDREL